MIVREFAHPVSHILVKNAEDRCDTTRQRREAIIPHNFIYFMHILGHKMKTKCLLDRMIERRNLFTKQKQIK